MPGDDPLASGEDEADPNAARESSPRHDVSDAHYDQPALIPEVATA